MNKHTFSTRIVNLNVFVSTGARVAKNWALYGDNALIFVATSGLHGPQSPSGLAIDFPICITMLVTYCNRKTAVVGPYDVWKKEKKIYVL